MVKRVGSWSCVAGGAAAQLGSESAALQLVTAFVPQAQGKMPLTIVKSFYCSCICCICCSALFYWPWITRFWGTLDPFLQAEGWVWGKPPTEQPWRSGAGALVWRDSRVCVSAESAAVTERGQSQYGKPGELSAVWNVAAEGGLCSCLLGPLLVALWPMQPLGWWEGRSISCSRVAPVPPVGLLSGLIPQKVGHSFACCPSLCPAPWGEGEDFRLCTETLWEGALDQRLLKQQMLRCAPCSEFS